MDSEVMHRLAVAPGWTAVDSGHPAVVTRSGWALVLAGEAAPAYDGGSAGDGGSASDDGRPAAGVDRAGESGGAGVEAVVEAGVEAGVEAVVEGLGGLDAGGLAVVGAALVDRLGGDAAALTGLAGQAVAALGGQAVSAETGGEGPAGEGAGEGTAGNGLAGGVAVARSVEGLARLERAAAAERLRRVAAIDHSGAYRASGHRSVEDWLARWLTLSRGQAKATAETARGLARLPRTAAGLAAGALGLDQVEIAARAAVGVDDQLPEHTPAAERADVLDELDELAADHCRGRNRGQVKATVDAWRHAIDTRYLVTRERRAHRDRGLTLGTDHSPGRLRLSHEGRALVQAALEPLARPRQRGDTRSQAQRTHDALVELCERHLDAGQLPEVAAQRPHAIITTTRQTQRELPGAAPAVLDGVGAISNSLAKLMTCDAEVTEVVVDAAGNPLIVSEPAKPTRKQRLAAIARDGCCIGCGAPAARCQLHHRVWRRHNGATVVDNLVLVCRQCHWLIHYDHWHVAHRHGHFTLQPPHPPGDPPHHHP